MVNTTNNLSIVLLIFLLGVLLPSSPIYSINTQSKSGRVFLVIAVDTEPNHYALDKYESQLDMSCFAKQGKGAMIALVMDDTWRNSWRDSFGNPLKITWFVMTHEAFLHSTNGNAEIVFDSLMTFEQKIHQLGDEIGWHYHHADWYDINNDGKYYWNQLLSFNGTRYTNGTDIEIVERMLNHLLVERNFFPSSFRSGWLWENNDFSAWLDEVVSFDYSASPQMKNVPRRIQPRQNQYDWSRSSVDFSGYHPHYRDYQRAGNMKRWLFSGIAPGSRTRLRQWESALKAAKRGEDQVVWIATHSFNNIRKFVNQSLTQLLKQSDSMGIMVQFATAAEAGVAVAGLTSELGAELKIKRRNDTLVVIATRPIFQKAPYCAMKFESGKYKRVRPKAISELKWFVIIPEAKVETLVCGACDDAGIPIIGRYDFN